MTARDDRHASEHLAECWLEPADLDRLLRVQNECLSTWTNRDGQPFGVVMSYVHASAPESIVADLGVSPAPSLWLTCATTRARVPAIRRTGYAALAITGRGTEVGSGRTASFRGPCTVGPHSPRRRSAPGRAGARPVVLDRAGPSPCRGLRRPRAP